jgi:transcriptional regulator
MPETILSERWREVTGFAAYQVSDRGRVRSRRAQGRRRGLADEWHVMKTSINRYTGYAAVLLIGEDGRRARRYVHRLALEAFVGPCPPGMECRHFPDNDRLNNRLENLSWASHAENLADRYVHGTVMAGGRHCFTSLTEGDVAEIRRRRAAGETHQAIAESFGVARETVSCICRGRAWKYAALEDLDGSRATREELGTAARGSHNGNAKLTAEQVIQVRARRAAGESQQRIADDFGVSQANISEICRRKVWAHV